MSSSQNNNNSFRMTLSGLTDAVTRTGESTGEFSIAEFCKLNNIGKRRLYDATDVMTVLCLLERKRVNLDRRIIKSFRWLGLEGMRQACADLFVCKPKTLLKQLFDRRHQTVGAGKQETHLTRTARFMACFYMHGFFKADYAKKNGQIVRAIKQYIEDTQLADRLGLNDMSSSSRSKNKSNSSTKIRADKNIFRRVYDVSNVFERVGFYKCADAVLNEMIDGQFTVSETGSPIRLPLRPEPPGFVYAIPVAFSSSSVSVGAASSSSSEAAVAPAAVAHKKSLEPFPNEDGISSEIPVEDGLMHALYASHADHFIYAPLDFVGAAAPTNINDELLAGIEDTMPFVF